MHIYDTKVAINYYTLKNKCNKNHQNLLKKCHHLQKLDIAICQYVEVKILIPSSNLHTFIIQVIGPRILYKLDLGISNDYSVIKLRVVDDGSLFSA